MATTYDKASLVMIPSGYKDDKLYSVKPTDGSGDFTFSRDGAGASPATRVNASGLIEKGRTNEILYSNAFNNAYWNKTAVTISTGQADPNGGNNAFKIVEDTSINFHRINGAYTMVSGNVYATSVTAKAAGRNFLSMSNNVSAGTTMFDLTDGSVHLQESGVVAAKTTDLGGGWYRCEMVAVGDKNGSYNVFLGCDDDGTIGTYLGDGTSGVLIFQSQLEDGLVATDYIETTTAAVSAGLLGDMPRLDYSGGATCPSLLLQPSRANIVENSEYFNGSSWTLNNVVITDNATTSPEGVDNAAKWAAASGFSLKSLYEVPTCASGVAHTATAYFKADEYPLAFIRLGGISGNPYVLYDLRDESLVATASLTSHDIKAVGNDWYRIEATATTTTTLIAPNIAFLPSSGYTLNANNIPEYTGDGTSGGFIYGAQVESASYPTSYIPTYGSASTRGADASSVTGASAIIGQTEGTIFIDYNSNITSDDSFFIVADDGTANNRIVLYSNVPNNLALVISTGGVLQSIIPNIPLASGTNKFAVGYANNDVVLYLNGTQVGIDNTASIPATSALRMATDHTNADYASGKGTKQALVFKTRLTNAELASLTTL